MFASNDVIMMTLTTQLSYVAFATGGRGSSPPVPITGWKTLMEYAVLDSALVVTSKSWKPRGYHDIRNNGWVTGFRE